MVPLKPRSLAWFLWAAVKTYAKLLAGFGWATIPFGRVQQFFFLKLDLYLSTGENRSAYWWQSKGQPAIMEIVAFEDIANK